MKKAKIDPKDFKIGTKRESLWTTIKENAEKELLQTEATVEINEAIIKMAETHIAHEKKLDYAS